MIHEFIALLRLHLGYVYLSPDMASDIYLFSWCIAQYMMSEVEIFPANISWYLKIRTLLAIR